MEERGACVATGRMNARRRAVIAPASTELTTPTRNHNESDDCHQQYG
jgi:hypothetical protein